MKRKIVWITIAILTMVVVAVYNHLGGFNSVNLEVVETNPYHLVGRYYEGKYDRDSIAALFFSAKDWMRAQKIAGTLSVVSYLGENDYQKSDSIQTFIGVIFSAAPPKNIAHYEYRKIEGGKKLRASMEAHSIVMPGRETIEAKMKAFAQQNQLLLNPMIIEKYISDEQMVIESIIAK